MKQFFLRDEDNFPIIFMGIVLLAFDFFVIMQGFIGWEKALIRLGIPSGVGLIVFVLFPSWNIIKTKILSHQKQKFLGFYGVENDFSKNANYKIKRSQAVARILKSIDELASTNQKDALKCVFLTGESGSGKSYLLNELLIPELKKCNKYSDIAYCVDPVKWKDVDTTSKTNDNPQIVIFDQLEYYYNKSDWQNTIKLLKSKNLIIVFAFQEKYMVELFKELKSNLNIGSDFYNRLLFLEADQNDIDELLECSVELFEKILDPQNTSLTKDVIRNEMQCAYASFLNSSSAHGEKNPSSDTEKNHYHRIRILCHLLAEIKKGRKPLVSFYAVAHIMELERFNQHAILSQVSTDSSDDLVELYLKEWANVYQNPENANAILYLLSSMRRYNKEDFENLIFERNNNYSTSGSCDNYFNELKQLFFIVKHCTHSRTELSLFLIHEYFSAKILDYLKSKDLSEIKENIDRHREILNLADRGKAKNSFSTRLDDYEKAQKCVRKFCVVLLAGIVIIQIYNFIVFYNGQVLSLADATQRIGLSIAMILSIYYVYNYIKKVFCLFDKKVYISASFFGMLSIWAAFFIPEWWGVPIGLNIFAIGFIQSRMIKKYNISALVELKGFTQSFGVIIVIFGVYYGFGFMQRDWFGMRFYLVESDIVGLFLLYSVYIASCVWMHINQRYILNKIIMINNFVHSTQKKM